jgi:hypothetical protein
MALLRHSAYFLCYTDRPLSTVGVVMVNVIMLSVAMPRVVKIRVVMLRIVMLSNLMPCPQVFDKGLRDCKYRRNKQRSINTALKM